MGYFGLDPKGGETSRRLLAFGRLDGLRFGLASFGRATPLGLGLPLLLGHFLHLDQECPQRWVLDLVGQRHGMAVRPSWMVRLYCRMS